MTAEIIFLSGAGDFHKMKAIDWLYIPINRLYLQSFQKETLALCAPEFAVSNFALWQP